MEFLTPKRSRILGPKLAPVMPTRQQFTVVNALWRGGTEEGRKEGGKGSREGARGGGRRGKGEWRRGREREGVS
eukprot:3377013-Rhodomonas_salina.1